MRFFFFFGGYIGLVEFSIYLMDVIIGRGFYDVRIFKGEMKGNLSREVELVS